MENEETIETERTAMDRFIQGLRSFFRWSLEAEKVQEIALVPTGPKRKRPRHPETGCYCDPDPEWQEYCHCWH